MRDAGHWLSRKQRRTFHQPCLRRECCGELIRVDGPDHRWFEGRGIACTLLVFIENATSTLMHLEFVASESTFSYSGALERYLKARGRPAAFTSDKRTVFRVAQQDVKSGRGMTQFGPALNWLNIEILCANSSQAKGRVERAKRLLNDSDQKVSEVAIQSGFGSVRQFNPTFMEKLGFSPTRHRAGFRRPEVSNLEFMALRLLTALSAKPTVLAPDSGTCNGSFGDRGIPAARATETMPQSCGHGFQAGGAALYVVRYSNRRVPP